MVRFLSPILLLIASVAGFLLFTKPIYDKTLELKENIKSYDEALNNSKALETVRDKLTEKYNSIELDNISKLEKMVPDNVDNIRLILEIEKLATPYGMILRDVKYDTLNTPNANTDGSDKKNVPVTDSENITKKVASSTNKNYGIWNLEFTTSGSYSNFLNFVKDLENNLRIVDISSISFTSDNHSNVGGTNLQLTDTYKYGFKIKTYWLKN